MLLLVLGCACKRGSLAKHEYMYVSAQETSLRDRVATMYNKIGTVHSGDRVEVLEKQRRFLRVRTDSGQEGWIEERSLVSQDVYDAFQKLASDNASQPVQAHGTTRSELNMHMTPSREGEHLYQLKDGEKVEVLKRATAEKNPPKASAPADDRIRRRRPPRMLRRIRKIRRVAGRPSRYNLRPRPCRRSRRSAKQPRASPPSLPSR